MALNQEPTVVVENEGKNPQDPGRRKFLRHLGVAVILATTSSLVQSCGLLKSEEEKKEEEYLKFVQNVKSFLENILGDNVDIDDLLEKTEYEKVQELACKPEKELAGDQESSFEINDIVNSQNGWELERVGDTVAEPGTYRFVAKKAIQMDRRNFEVRLYGGRMYEDGTSRFSIDLALVGKKECIASWGCSIFFEDRGESSATSQPAKVEFATIYDLPTAKTIGFKPLEGQEYKTGVSE